jgi:tRNA A-37 threonylcarbamoyl transferase component Bud32
VKRQTLGSLGRYRLIRRLGRGGMAEVFEGRAEGAAGVTKAVCVKRILPAYAQNRGFVRMFVDEARVSMALHHGNIAQVFDFGQEGHDLFLAMELVDGTSLWHVRRRLAKRGIRFPTPLALHVVQEVCKALHHAHTCTDERGRPLEIVHRDVSPQNVLLSYEGQVKLVDFGIARAASVAEDGGGVKGKLPYMAPEQARGEDVDRRADVFGVGAVLFELLTDRTPIEGSTATLLHRLDTGDVPSISEVAPGLDPALCAIVDRALAVDPAERFASALSLQEALAHYAHHSGQRASEDEMGMLVRHLFSTELVEAGRTLDLPADFERTLNRWRLDAGDSGRQGLTRLLVASGILLVLIAGAGLGWWLSGASGSGREVAVRSDPPGARVLLDGEEIGVITDGVLRGVDIARVHELTFVLDGFERRTHTLLPGDDTVQVRLSRERLARPDAEPGLERPSRAEIVGQQERRPPVHVMREGDRIALELDPAAVSLSPRRLLNRWWDLDPRSAHRVEVAGEILMSLARYATTMAWVALDADDGISAQGLVRPGAPARVPAGSARITVFFPEGQTCTNNSGDVSVLLRRGDRPVHRFLLDPRTDCVSVDERLRVRVPDLDTDQAYLIRYESPEDGPPVVLPTTSTNPLSLARPPEEGTEMLRPGEAVVMRHIGTIYPVIFQDLEGDAHVPVRLVLERREAAPIDRRRVGAR